jgi:type I restriction-modification system DNA methylase subunit
MKSNGKGACILPHGVLFRGNAEAVIREQLVRSGYLKGIIGLPANLFYGTGIPACILVLDKENAKARKGVFMIDASKGGSSKDGQQEPTSTSTCAAEPRVEGVLARRLPALDLRFCQRRRGRAGHRVQ